MLVVVPLVGHRLVVLSHHDRLRGTFVGFPQRALVLMMGVPTFIMIHYESFLGRQNLVDGMSFLVEHAGLNRDHTVSLPLPSNFRRLVLRQQDIILLELPHHAPLVFRCIDQYGMRAPLINPVMSGVHHHHLADLSLDEAVKQSIGDIDRVFLEAVGEVNCLLDGRVSRLAEGTIQNALVQKVREQKRCQEGMKGLGKCAGQEVR